MTIGARIAQHRRELGMSQEELGEAMGVSRQAISKWESDAALPEVEKLIALSRLFSIPVGQLLGVEEPPMEESGGAAEPEGDADGRAARLAEEVLRRYVEAQYSPPVKPAKPRWKPWAAGSAAAAVVLLCAGQVVSDFQDQIRSLQRQTDEIQSSQIEVNNQVSSITQRVEESLASQASRLVNSELTMEALDLAAGTATVGAAVTPKAVEEGLTLELVVIGDGQSWRADFAPGEDGLTYTAAVTLPLEDGLRYYVTFRDGQGQETEELEPNGAFFYLAENTALNFDANVGGGGWFYDGETGEAVVKDLGVYAQCYSPGLWREDDPVQVRRCTLTIWQGETPVETIPMEREESSDRWFATYWLEREERRIPCAPEEVIRLEVSVEDEYGRTASRTVGEYSGDGGMVQY